MASNIKASTLTVKISELIELNGKNRGSNNVLNISNINEVDNRIVTLPSGSQTTLFSLSNNPGAGTFVTSSLKYARITNKDDSYHVRLRVSSSVGNAMDFKIEPETSFILSNSKVTGSLGGLDLNSTFSYDNVKYVNAEPSGSNVDVEIFIAST